uniref:Si:ch211-145o7.3 n=1 Tax=Myripristis murdjan TaxID=586833 RepID=A0A667YKY3_9TELE
MAYLSTAVQLNESGSSALGQRWRVTLRHCLLSYPPLPVQPPRVGLCLSSNTSDQDDLTCLSWLHQRGNLLPLQPLPKMTPLPQREAQSAAPTQALPSSSSKPPYSFSSLIFMAIEDSPDKRLPVKGIYEWIVNNFPYYRTASGGWRNSVRHNLSLSKSFRRIHRDRSQVSTYCDDVPIRYNRVMWQKIYISSG